MSACDLRLFPNISHRNAIIYYDYLNGISVGMIVIPDATSKKLIFQCIPTQIDKIKCLNISRVCQMMIVPVGQIQMLQ